jgi:hypothetical protein
MATNRVNAPRVVGTSVRNWIKFRRQRQARLTVVGGATVAHIRRPLPRKAVVIADIILRR